MCAVCEEGERRRVGARAVSSSARSAWRRQLVIPREAGNEHVKEQREGEEEKSMRKSKESSLREGNWWKAVRMVKSWKCDAKLKLVSEPAIAVSSDQVCLVDLTSLTAIAVSPVSQTLDESPEPQGWSSRSKSLPLQSQQPTRQAPISASQQGRLPLQSRLPASSARSSQQPDRLDCHCSLTGGFASLTDPKKADCWRSIWIPQVNQVEIQR